MMIMIDCEIEIGCDMIDINYEIIPDSDYVLRPL